MLKVYAAPLTLSGVGLALLVVARMQVALDWPRLQTGAMGFMALGVNLAFLLWLLGVRSVDNLLHLQTPRNSVTFHAAAAITWLSFVLAEWANLEYSDARGGLSAPAPAAIAPLAVFALVALPVILLGVYLCIRTTRLPVQLWTAPFFSSFVGVAVLIALTFAVAVVVEAVFVNVFLMPSSLASIYLLLCGRAAAARAA